MDIIYWSFVHLVRDRVKGVYEEGIVNIASYEYHFIRVHENLVKHPSNLDERKLKIYF